MRLGIKSLITLIVLLLCISCLINKTDTEAAKQFNNVPDSELEVLEILNPKNRPAKSTCYQYTSPIKYILSSDSISRVSSPIKTETHIFETQSKLTIYQDFNKDQQIFNIISIKEFKDGLSYTVEVDGISKEITKTYSPRNGICFILENEWMLDEIEENSPISLD